MSGPRIVLIHGYTGSPDGLGPLARGLAARFGGQAVSTVALPGHDQEAPPFDPEAFIGAIRDAVNAHEGKSVVIIGHSTGGTLALSFIEKYYFTPALLVLIATPKQVEPASLERWAAHRAGKGAEALPFTSVAGMVSLIRATGAKGIEGEYPALVVSGGEDRLVPAADGEAWVKGRSNARGVMVPAATHSFFHDDAVTAEVTGIIADEIDDATAEPSSDDLAAIAALRDVEPESAAFIDTHPLSIRHIGGSPSGRALIGKRPALAPVCGLTPVFANIEVTTRCNLRCPHCARTKMRPEPSDMGPETFRRTLERLPHAYRVTLVGLGEPLLNPHIVELVAHAASEHRRVALVTNAMLLDEAMGRALLRAGLGSIAFSLDASEQSMADRVRPGTDVALVLENIRRFVALTEGTDVSTAVFTAVSRENVGALDHLVGAVKATGVKVMMISDLNFGWNVPDTLWRNAGDETAACVRQAVAAAFRQGLPVLSVHGLEEFGLARRYAEFLLIPPERLMQRATRRASCCSPWQTVPVDVSGNVTLCDCQPESVIGNLLTQPFGAIWNSPLMTAHRASMLGVSPPEACLVCPRF